MIQINEVVVRMMLVTLMVGGAWAQEAGKQEQVDNPQYKSWVQFKVGSFAELKSVTAIGQSSTVMSMTYTLKSVAADKLVVTMQTAMEIAGKKMAMPASDMVIPAKIAKGKEKAPSAAKKGSEKLKLAGSKLDCKWIEQTIAASGSTTKSKVWMCDDIPGGMVKMTASTTGEVKSESTMTLAKFKATKK